MLKINDTDSFGVELGKTFAQSLIGTVVATTAMLGGFAIVGTVFDRLNRRSVKKNEKIVPETAPQE